MVQTVKVRGVDCNIELFTQTTSKLYSYSVCKKKTKPIRIVGKTNKSSNNYVICNEWKCVVQNGQRFKSWKGKFLQKGFNKSVLTKKEQGILAHENQFRTTRENEVMEK